MKKIIIISALLALISACWKKNEVKELQLNEVSWESIFGSPKPGDNHIFCVLGQGFFKTPRSDNADSLMADWLKKHPEAKVIPVSTLVDTSMNDIETRMTYCWIVDGTNNINIYLVENGCYPPGTMMRPNTWNEMSKEEKDIYRGMDIPDVRVHIEDIKYKEFVKKLGIAAEKAKSMKSGVWKTHND